MDSEINGTIHQWLDSTFLVVNESYQVDIRRILSTDSYELMHVLCDFYMYDHTALFLHLIGLTSHYLTATSFIYADNQLRHKLNMHLLLIARQGYERSTLVEHVKQSMNNVQSIRQTGKQFDSRHHPNSNVFCQSDDLTSLSHGYCLSDQFDEHVTSTHLQKQQTSSILGISNGDFIHQLLEKKFHKKSSHLNYSPNWFMMFLNTKTQLFSRRMKIFDLNQYPLLEHLILMINCLCSYSIDFYFEQTHANQIMCDYLDTLALKGISLEETHPWMAGKYVAAREHVLRLSASLAIIEIAVETLIIYRETFQTFGQADKIFFDNCIRLIEQTRGTTSIKRILINANIVQSAVYFLDMSLKQFEIVFEPSLTSGSPTHEYE